jgi:hypothetical protein
MGGEVMTGWVMKTRCFVMKGRDRIGWGSFNIM